MDYLARIATAIAVRLHDPANSWEQYLEQCQVAGKRVNGMPPEMIREAAETAWMLAH